MKSIGTHKLRYLSLGLALTLCLGLFAGCSTKDSDPSSEPSDAVTESPSTQPSTQPSADPSTDPSDNTGDGDVNDQTLTDVVGKVTAIDGQKVTVQIYAAPADAGEIENYGAVDLNGYTETEATDEVDLTDAMIALAENDALTQTTGDQIAVGDMLLLSYSGSTLLQAVIYQQSAPQS